MNKLKAFFIKGDPKVDPIKAMETQLEKLKSDGLKMGQQINVLQTELKRMERLFNQNEKELEDCIYYAEKAKEKGNEIELMQYVKKAERLKASSDKQVGVKQRLDSVYETYSRLYKHTQWILDDTSHEFKVLKQEISVLNAAKNAENVLSELEQKTGSSSIDNQLSELKYDLDEKLIEIDQFMEVSDLYLKEVSGDESGTGFLMLEDFKLKHAHLFEQ